MYLAWTSSPSSPNKKNTKYSTQNAKNSNNKKPNKKQAAASTYWVKFQKATKTEIIFKNKQVFVIGGFGQNATQQNQNAQKYI